MFGRPRCREWTPLATQQLRLRSLIQIVGYNIRPPEGCSLQCSFYLTLHHTTMSAPFYTSERISSPHPKWKEIDSELTHRMSSTNVVIRIWCHTVAPSSEANVDAPQDTVIQTWGVYFTGLRYIGANLSLNFTSDSFKSNTLVFQMHGGYFCSYKSLKLDIIPPENEIEHGSLSSDSSGKTSRSRPIDSKLLQNHKFLKESRSVSPSQFSKKYEKEYSKSNSPADRGFKQNFPTIRASASLNISQRDGKRREDSNERKKTDANYIYEHSPDNLDDKDTAFPKYGETWADKNIDSSEPAESYDLRNENESYEETPKLRYLALNFLKSEIRPSYNASKLQKLHLLQYSIKKRQEAVQEIKERIYQKSALTNNSWPQPEDQYEERVKFRSRSQKNLFSPDDESMDKQKSTSQSDLSFKNGRIKEDKPPVSNGPRLALKLNDLLSFKSKPSPFQRAEHIRLTKQLEILRFKRIILSDERDSKLANIRRLKERRAKLFEENQDVGSELMENYHNLSRRSDTVKEKRQSCCALRELAARSHAALASLRCELLAQLHEIFYIQQKDQTTWTIIDVPLPICGDESPRGHSAVSESVSAGYVAQCTSLAAGLLAQPLRYRLALRGSASEVADDARRPPAQTDIPLYARGGDASLFLYGMFLVNKCIGQLLWARGASVPDLRPTLRNLQRLLTMPANLSDTSKLFGTYRWLADGQCPRAQSLRSLLASDRGKYRQFNRFKDAVDGQSPQTAILKRHRHSRSVGSYNDDQELPNLDASTTSIMGSEPNIYNMKLTQAHSADIPPPMLKSHNSDSEILRLATGEKTNEDAEEKKVIFTLGDDTTLANLETEKLVRLSSNNGDANAGLDENVKRICSEIESFCSTSETRDVHEGFDVAKHIENMGIVDYMEGRCSAVENVVVSCKNCDNSDVCDIVCAKNVTDVIVIPSAEAILDTGQQMTKQDGGPET